MEQLNCQRIAIGYADGEVSLWKWTDGKLILEWEQWQPHFESVDRVLFLSDAQTVVTCSRDATVKFWNVPARTELEGLAPTKNSFSSLAVSRDGKRLAAGTSAGHVHLWDVESRRQVATFLAGDRRVNRIAFTDENTLACDVRKKGLVVFKVPTWEQIQAQELAERSDAD